MTVQSGPAGNREKEIKTEWPVEEGDQFGTTKTHEKEIYLVPEEGSNVLSTDSFGL